MPDNKNSHPRYSGVAVLLFAQLENLLIKDFELHLG